MTETISLLDKFKHYVNTFTETDKGQIKRDPNDERFNYCNIPVPYWDFNWVINTPGFNERFPEGVAGIYMDEDFWLAAVFPYEYRELDLKDVISIIFPYVEEIKINPTTIDFDYGGKCSEEIKKFQE